MSTMITCEAPNQKLNYIFSCHLLAQVQVKVGKLEGERSKPSYKDLLENPILNYSGVFQHFDLYVTMQIFANNQPLCMPIRTSYKYIEKLPWSWDEWLTMPLRIRDLPRNSQLTITVWDIESPQVGDVPVCGATISLFDKYGEFRQGLFELRMWPNKAGDGSVKTSTPGFLTDCKENELEESFMLNNNGNTMKNQQIGDNTSSTSSSSSSNNNQINLGTNSNGFQTNSNLFNNNTSNAVDEFPILDELDRLAKMSKYHTNGQMIKQDWLDRLTLKEIQKAVKNEKEASKFFHLTIELAQIKCEDTKYTVLYYEEDAERIIQTIPTNELFVVNDPELEIDNIIELKHRKLEHSKQMGVFDMNLKPDTDSKNLLTKIVNYPVTRTLKREELTLLWKYRYYLTQNKKALTKVLQCFDLNLEFEKNIYSELILKWQPMDIEDALELLGSKYKDHPKIRSYAISRLTLASNEDLILYLLQLVQALRYENFQLSYMSLENANDPSKSKSVTNTNNKQTNLSKSIINSRKNSFQQSTEQLNKAKSELATINNLIAATNNNNNNNNNNNINNTLSNTNKLKRDSTDQTKNEVSNTQPIASSNLRTNLTQSDTLSKNIFDLNLKTFLLQRATQNELVALCLYWFVKVEIKDTKSAPVLSHSSSSGQFLNKTDQSNNILYNNINSNVDNNNSSSLSSENNNNNNEMNNDNQNTNSENKSKNNQENFENIQENNTSGATTTTTTTTTNTTTTQINTKNISPSSNTGSSSNLANLGRTNFQIFMDELLDNLRNGNSYAKSLYESILNQEKFLKSLNEVVKAVQREDTKRDKKVIKLRTFLSDTSKSQNTINLVDFDTSIPLILDPNVKVKGIDVEKTTMFKSNLMPCKFVFKSTIPDEEYSAIYKIGDDLRQDQLVLQMIALMDKLLKQENLDLKLTPYKVVATGIKEGFLQFVDAIPVSNILNGEYRTIKEYLRRNNPSDTDKYGIDSNAMDFYVRSCAGYMVITYILGVGDRHYDNILITKDGRMLHIDFGYILGRDPKPFQPIIKWTKDMADGMGGKYGPDGKENKEYEDFKKYCCNAFLHLRRHANLILNLFSLMVDANIPDIAIEPDKTVKKIMDRFKLDSGDEQAQILLLKEIESNYDTIVGNITDIIHTYSTAQK